MNRKHGIIAVAFLAGALAASGVWRLGTAPVADAQAMNPVVATRLNNLDKRLAALEGIAARGNQGASNTAGGQLHSGTSSATSSAAGQNAQLNQDVVLQNEVDALKAQLAKQQTEFNNHYHTYTTESDPGLAHGIETILQCQGYGKPCTSATSLNEITVFVPPTSIPPAQSYTVKTSGPVQPAN